MSTTQRSQCPTRPGFAAVAILATTTILMPIPAAQAGLSVRTCGPAINSVVTTQNNLTTTSSASFVDLPGAVQNISVQLSAGTLGCVKVVFTAEAACLGSAAGGNICFIQALLDDVPMQPQGGGRQAFISQDVTASAHAYEWVRRVGEGNHVVRIQQRVGDANTVFEIDDWTFDIQIYE